MSRTALPPRRVRWIRARLRAVAFHCVVWTLVGVMLVPLVWPLMNTLHSTSVTNLVDNGIVWWIRGIDAWRFVYNLPRVLPPLENSVVVATATALLSTAFAATAAYGVQRFEFTGRRVVVALLLLFPAVPQTVVAIPLYLFFLDTPLFDTQAGLVVAYLAYTLPFTTLLLIPYFASIPRWLEDAALVDGTTRFGAFLRIFLPNVKPGLAAAFVLAWMLAYNESIYAVMLIDTDAKLPLSAAFGNAPPLAGGLISFYTAIPMVGLFAVLWFFFLSGEVRRWTG